MIAFQVDDMTCGHCASAIGKALRSVDESARVSVDLARSRVDIEPAQGRADVQALSDAITQAGYTPVLLRDPAEHSTAPRRSGCCCG